MSFPVIPQTKLQANGTTPGRDFPQAKFLNLIVDSRARDFSKYANSSSFVVSLPERIHHVRSAVLVDAEIPASYYVFSSARGTNSMQVYLDATGYTITIPDGNYSASEMVTALQSALDTAFGASVFTVTFSSKTQKFTFTASGTVSIVTSSWPTGAPYTGWGLPYYLGFNQYSGSNPSGSGSLTSTNSANLNPETYLVVAVDELSGSYEQCALYGQGGRGIKPLAKIPISENSYNYIITDKSVAYSYLDQEKTISKLTISLRFPDGTLVNLNGQEWSFTVQLACADVK
jgi:hypothetical protein